MKMKILVLLALISLTFCDPFDAETFKIFISSTKGKITRRKLTTKKDVGYLDISFSTVEAIEPDSLCALPNLKTLFINGNDQFPKICKQLFQCTPKLNYITLDALERTNQELDRDAFTGLKELNFLRINDVKIGRVGKDMFENTNLEFLNLVGCKIEEIEADAFSTASNLKELHLGHNLIKSFQPGTFKNLPILRELLLNKNEIGAIDWEQWNPLPSLKMVDFADNPLKTCKVSKIKEYFPSIDYCNLGGNFNETEKGAMKDEAAKLNIKLRFINYY